MTPFPPGFAMRRRARAALPAILLALILAWQGAANAEESQPEHLLTGDFRSDYYSTSKAFNGQHNLLGYTAELKLASEWTPNLSSKVFGRFNDSDVKDSSARVELLEAFTLWRHESADLRIGKQIIAWGRADGINPTDNLTPRNYRINLPYEEDQRSGVPLVKLDYFPAEQKTVTLYVTPFFQESKIPLPNVDGLSYLNEPPEPGHWSVAAKYDQKGDNLDWSVSYFHGHNLLPEAHQTFSYRYVSLYYPKISVFGADAALNLGRYAWRAEFAYTMRDEPQPLATEGLRNNWALVSGFDRTFDGELNVNVQMIVQQNYGLANLAYFETATGRALATANTITFRQQQATTLGYTTRIKKEWLNGTLSAEILAFGYVNPFSAYGRPLLAYALTDAVKLTVGADLFFGGTGTFFGRNKPISNVFAEVRYSF
jgi:hypothetical protein